MKPQLFQNPYKLIQCDTQDAKDGLSIFNLDLASEPIGGNTEYEVFFYHSIAEAENDLNNTESIPPLYKTVFQTKLYTLKSPSQIHPVIKLGP
jgi:hypothetical protein